MKVVTCPAPFKTDIISVGVEVLTAAVMRISNLWDITACSPLKVNIRFGITRRPSLLYSLWLYRRFFSFLILQISRWQRGLKHELSSPARTLGSNPTRGMDVCVCSVFILFCL
jgi:hypothetical protein